METEIEKQATYKTIVLESKVLRNKCNEMQDMQDLYNEYCEHYEKLQKTSIYSWMVE